MRIEVFPTASIIGTHFSHTSLSPIQMPQFIAVIATLNMTPKRVAPTEWNTMEALL